MKSLWILFLMAGMFWGGFVSAEEVLIPATSGQRPYFDIAVDGDLVYLAHGSKGVLVYSQSQDEVISVLTRLQGRRIYADQVQVVGDELFVYGQNHFNGGIYGTEKETRDFWIDVFDLQSLEHKQSIRVDLMEALAGPDQLVDLPSMVGQYDGVNQQFYISFVHIKSGSFLWTLPRTEEAMAEYRYHFSETVEFPSAANQFAIAEGLLYVGTGRGELFEVAPGTGETTKLASDLGYIVDVVKRNDDLYLADYNGRLLQYSLQKQKLVSELPSRNGFVSALDVTPSCATYLLLDKGFVKITQGKK